MEIDKESGQYTIKGGKTIIGKLFSYQEKTGMSLENIMKMPYIQFVIGMLDAPSVDWDSKKPKEKINRAMTVDDEINTVMRALS